MGSTCVSENIEEQDSFNKFKSSFITAISYNDHDFPSQNGYLMFQKDNENNKIFIKTLYFQSKHWNLLLNLIAEIDFEQYREFFLKKIGWDHPNIAKVMRLEKHQSKNELNCFGEGLSCSTIFSAGICTVKGLLYRIENNLDSDGRVNINSKFYFQKKETISDKILLSEGQIIYCLNTLIKVAQYYKSQSDVHGDFNPMNISKTSTQN